MTSKPLKFSILFILLTAVASVGFAQNDDSLKMATGLFKYLAILMSMTVGGGV